MCYILSLLKIIFLLKIILIISIPVLLIVLHNPGFLSNKSIFLSNFFSLSILRGLSFQDLRS